jgi:hypothetical protein
VSLSLRLYIFEEFVKSELTRCSSAHSSRSGSVVRRVQSLMSTSTTQLSLIDCNRTASNSTISLPRSSSFLSRKNLIAARPPRAATCSPDKTRENRGSWQFFVVRLAGIRQPMPLWSEKPWGIQSNATAYLVVIMISQHVLWNAMSQVPLWCMCRGFPCSMLHDSGVRVKTLCD